MERSNYLIKIKEYFAIFPIVALLGPRQSGKTTLARAYRDKIYSNKTFYLDLEDPTDLAKLENPKQLLQGLTGLIIIDEVQMQPELFKLLRVLVDEDSNSKQFLILGSASRDLINQSSETLAGRIGYIEVKPFDLSEFPNFDQLWLRGGFPRSVLAATDSASFIWRKEYIKSFFERDIPQLGIDIPARSLYKLWQMLIHYHGNIINYSELGRSLGISDTTAKKYIDILEGTFVIRQLRPWHANIAKRQVKNAKLYFRDSGLLHVLMSITSKDELVSNLKVGASFEGIVIEEIIRFLNLEVGEVFFWATHNNAELDLLIVRHGRKYGIEVKYTDSPSMTKSMRIALEDLNIEKIIVIYPGKGEFIIGDRIIALGTNSQEFSVRLKHMLNNETSH
mgnify:CR=1 FL=1